MTTALLPDEAGAAVARDALERRVLNEKCRYYVPHGKFDDFLLEKVVTLKDEPGKIWILIYRGPNGWGKTAFIANLTAYLLARKPNPHFDKIPYLKNFRLPCRGRLLTTPNAAEATYPEETAKWYPKGEYEALNVGHHFPATYRFKKTRSEMDVFTFKQDPMESESVNLDFAVIDEPPPHRYWSGLVTRFRRGGLIVMVFTGLEGASWVSDELETPEHLNKDVFVLQGHRCDNCIEHGRNGVLPHAYWDNIAANTDPSEHGARLYGEYLCTSGRIYGTYRTGYTDQDGKVIGHEPERLAPYYADCWKKRLFTLYNIVDPHDRKPWAVGWYSVFPNEDVFTIKEWPDRSLTPYHKFNSCAWVPADYVRMIRLTESAPKVNAHVRLMDPHFGNAPKSTTKTTTAGECADPKNDPDKEGLHFLLPESDVEQGHIAVKVMLGNPGIGVKPRFYVMAHCTNHRWAMTHYGYKETRDDSRGPSTKPELIHKDFPDLVRLGALWGFRYLGSAPKELKLWKPREHAGSHYRGI